MCLLSPAGHGVDDKYGRQRASIALPGLEASSVACVRTYRCTGRVDGCSGRCDLLLTREARFDSAPHWPAIRLSRVRLSVVCVRRSRERGLDSRGVRRWARARRQIISRFVAHGDGGEQCGPRSVRRRDLPFWPRAEFVPNVPKQQLTNGPSALCVL
eukprot:scaffold59749_cov73-Phaeocystis_antarctica.AAC.6